MQAAFWTTVGLLCLTTAGLGNAQKPQPCQAPSQYTGKMTMEDEKHWIVGNYAYDATNQRMYMDQKETLDNNSVSFESIMLFQEGIDYEIDRLNKSCVKMPISANFPTIEVPDGAAFVSQVVLGTSSSPGQGLLVNTWRGDKPDYEISYFASFTEFGCFPVSVLIKPKNSGVVGRISYYDNVVGVDPDVFVPPPFCKDAKLQANKDGKDAIFFSFKRD